MFQGCCGGGGDTSSTMGLSLKAIIGPKSGSTLLVFSVPSKFLIYNLKIVGYDSKTYLV